MRPSHSMRCSPHKSWFIGPGIFFLFAMLWWGGGPWMFFFLFFFVFPMVFKYRQQRCDGKKAKRQPIDTEKRKNDEYIRAADGEWLEIIGDAPTDHDHQR